MINETAVIGAGLMGRSISQAYALKNCSVKLYDNNEQVRSGVKNLIDNCSLRGRIHLPASCREAEVYMEMRLVARGNRGEWCDVRIMPTPQT